MFGNSYDICREYSNYFLDYQDHRNLQDQYMRWSNRIISDYGDWSGNIFDFFNRITLKLTEDIPVPFKMKGIYRDDIVPMKKAIREALCNTLCNADYHQSVGLVIKQYSDKIVFSNPGVLTMPINEILQGGTSKPRNKTLLKMFNLINIGERAGSGIPLIIQTTKEEKYPKPNIYDRFNPDITYFTIFIKNLGNNNEILGNNDEILGNNDNKSVNATIEIVINNLQLKTDVKEKLLIITNYFNDKIFGNCDIQKYLSCNKNTATFYIKMLKEANLIISISGHGKGKYKFKKTDSA